MGTRGFRGWALAPWLLATALIAATPNSTPTPYLRIPRDGDQRSEVMAITIPK